MLSDPQVPSQINLSVHYFAVGHVSVYDFALELFLIMGYVSRTGFFTVMYIYIYILLYMSVAIWAQVHLANCAYLLSPPRFLHHYGVER
jgi:hypothetical protein